MLIIDENVSEIEVWRLREWGIAVRQIGPDILAWELNSDLLRQYRFQKLPALSVGQPFQPKPPIP